MAYQFVAGEDAAEAVRRIASEQYDRIAAELERFAEEPAEAVHDARRRIKETRSLLRLVRDTLGDTFRGENIWLRDRAHQLAAARDVDAQSILLRKMRSTLVDSAGLLAYGSARRALTRRAHGAHHDIHEVIDTFRMEIKQRGKTIVDWPLSGDFELIEPGFRRSYARGRAVWKVAMESRSDHDLHEWRKRVKDLGYHLQLLLSIAPDLLKPTRQMADRLAKLLGEHHDLAMTIGTMRAVPFRKRERKERVVEALQQRQREIEAEADSMAMLLYAEKSSAWISRMEHYWESSKTNTKEKE